MMTYTSSGVYPKGDFYKFVGHELFVIFFSFLIREGRWDQIANLLEENIYLENTRKGMPDVVSFDYVCKYIELLDERNRRLNLHKISLHADILNRRHSQGDLAELVPMQQFMDADFFLFLRKGSGWIPQSAVYIENQPPRYLIEASRARYAQQLLRPLGFENFEALRAHLSRQMDALKELFGRRLDLIFWNFNPQAIGSR